MAGGRRIPVTVEADTDGDFSKAARGLDDVAKEADGADGSLRRMSKGVQALDAEIDKTAYSVKSLRDEFSRTGDIGLLGDIGKQERTLNKLRGSLADFTRDVEDDTKKSGGLLEFALDEAVVNGLKRASGAIGGAMSSIGDAIAKNPVVSTAIVGAVVAGVPYIVGALSAAVGAGVSAGFAGGVIALGISRAVADTRVTTAWTGLFAGVQSSLDSASGRFVEPLIRGAAKVEDAWKSIFPHLDNAMNGLAPTVDRLFTGIQGFISALGPGIDALSNVGGTLLQDLADRLPEIGQFITEFFQSIERGGPHIRNFFNDLIDFGETALVVLGWLADKGSRLYDVFAGLSLILTGQFSEGIDRLVNAGAKGSASIGGFHNTTIDTHVALGLLNGTLQKTADGTIVAANGAQMLDAALANVNKSVTTTSTVYGAAVDKILSTTMALDQATLGFAESQTRLGESIKNNSTNLDLNSAKGQANREAILGAVQANQANFDAMIRAGSGADQARQAYDSNTRALEAQLHQAGFTQGQIDNLIGKYRSVPGDVNTDINISGLAEAIGGLDDTLRRINGLDGRVSTSYIRTIHQQIFADPIGHFTPNGGASGPAQRHGGIMAAAHGMIVDSPTVLFGERGTKKETYVPWAGISSQRAYELMAPTAANFGMDLVDPRRGGSGYANSVSVSAGNRSSGTVQLNWGGYVSGDPLGRALVEFIQEHVQFNGGGNVQEALGRRGA